MFEILIAYDVHLPTGQKDCWHPDSPIGHEVNGATMVGIDIRRKPINGIAVETGSACLPELITGN
ncbi:MAG: hypothetical protein ING37_09430 [Rhodocyclaceae bacterium]|nr:hypothetical protein [Rhodocyclaceae bacterium]